MILSPTRLLALLRKEFIQMRRDRITFAMMLIVPVMQLLLFGFAINTDPKQMPAALVAPADDRFARAIVTALENTGYYRFVAPHPTAEMAERMLTDGRVSFVVTMAPGFGADLQRGDRAQLLIEADATDPAAASGAISTLGTVAAQALSRELGPSPRAPGPEIVVHRRYNPEGLTQLNIVPGLLGIILQMTMVMMTSMALTREIERGTMENLLAMPATPAEIMVGKVTPFLAVGAVQVAVILLAARAIFDVPFVGSPALLLAGVFLFVLALVLLGCPGWVRTVASMRSLGRMSAQTGRTEDDLLAEITGNQILPGLMEPADMASAYLFLSSAAARNITGQALMVDRGEVMA